MNRPENGLGSGRSARFARSWVEVDEGWSYSTQQPKESGLTMTVSRRESCLTAFWFWPRA
eukprot:5299221-Pleurochrysis_carterae.AAC.1